MPTKKSQEIHLKPLSVEFIDAYCELLNDPEVHKTTQPYEVFRTRDREELLKWLRKITGRNDRKDFAILFANTDEFLGEVVINEVQEKTANIRIAIGSRYWGQGYGFQAMKKALDYAFTQMALEQITLSVFDINQRGLNLYKKLGFEVVELTSYQGFPETLMRVTKSSFVSNKNI